MTTNVEIAQTQYVKRACRAFLVSVAVAASAFAQSFDSGSDGSDGALVVPAGAGAFVFDPDDTARWGRVLDPDRDGVYNFTTISIGSGGTLQFRGDIINRPVYWLASGDVDISSPLILSGGSGPVPSDLLARRQVAVPGPGGYAGGAGGRIATGVPATPGQGPGGGTGGIACGVTEICGQAGTFSGNRLLIPLTGGSGGEGATWSDSQYKGGGAGGGAILIASSTSITLTASIIANGGNGGGNVGGPGSGGAIRLVAPTLAGNGSGNFQVLGGTAGSSPASGGTGWVRLEGFDISPSFTFSQGTAFLTRGSPVDSASLRPVGSIRITAIDGQPVSAAPGGSFQLPDVSINDVGPVNVDIEASGVPPGTVVTLQVFPETPADQTLVNLPEVQATLAGTLQSTTATATFTFPFGFSRGFVRASWTE